MREPGVIVIDDLHLASPQPETLTAFVDALPDHFRFVAGTRADPPLSLTRLQSALSPAAQRRPPLRRRRDGGLPRGAADPAVRFRSAPVAPLHRGMAGGRGTGGDRAPAGRRTGGPDGGVRPHRALRQRLPAHRGAGEPPRRPGRLPGGDFGLRRVRRTAGCRSHRARRRRGRSSNSRGRRPLPGALRRPGELYRYRQLSARPAGAACLARPAGPRRPRPGAPRARGARRRRRGPRSTRWRSTTRRAPATSSTPRSPGPRAWPRAPGCRRRRSGCGCTTTVPRPCEPTRRTSSSCSSA